MLLSDEGKRTIRTIATLAVIEFSILTAVVAAIRGIGVTAERALDAIVVVFLAVLLGAKGPMEFEGRREGYMIILTAML